MLAAVRSWLARFPPGLMRPGALSVTDQAVISATNFAVGVTLARLTPAANYGAYALAIGVMLILASVQAAMVTTPLTILGAALAATALGLYQVRELLGRQSLAGAGALLREAWQMGRYDDSAGILLLWCATLAVMGLRVLPGTALKVMRRLDLTMVAHLAAGGSVVVISLAMCWVLGPAGAALAKLVGELVLVGVTAFFLTRELRRGAAAPAGERETLAPGPPEVEP